MGKKFLHISTVRWLHIIACFVLVCIVAIVDFIEWQRPNIVAACIGAIIAFFIGLLKEIIWGFIIGRSRFSIKNIAADLTGSLWGFLFMWLAMSLGCR